MSCSAEGHYGISPDISCGARACVCRNASTRTARGERGTKRKANWLEIDAVGEAVFPQRSSTYRSPTPRLSSTQRSCTNNPHTTNVHVLTTRVLTIYPCASKSSFFFSLSHSLCSFLSDSPSAGYSVKPNIGYP